MVLFELAADDAGLAGGGHAEIMGQLQLAPAIAVGPHQVFHDGQEHSGRVFGQGPSAVSITSRRSERRAFNRSSTPPISRELSSCATAYAERRPWSPPSP